MDQVRFPFPPMVTDKTASLFLNFPEIDEVGGPNGFVHDCQNDRE
jgi:hypothetical protein